MSFLSRLGRIIGVLVAALVVTGCSTLKLGYNNLPDLAYWWLDGYMHFSEAQAPRVKDELARLHRWHRQEELPRLADLLRRAEQLGPSDIAPAQACALLAEGQERLVVAARQAEAAVPLIAAGLTPHSMRHLARRHERNNATFRREWIDAPAAQRLDRRLRQVEERLERVYGTLEPAQREALRQSIERSSFDPARVLAERQRRQADLLDTLQRLRAPGLPAPEAQRLVRGYVDRLQSSPDPAWRAHGQSLTQEGCAMFAAVHNAAGPAQRQAAVNRVRGYLRDLSDLAART